MKDIILEKFGEYSPEIKCLDKGFVKLIDCMPRMVEDAEDSADYAIAEAARCSYQRGTKTINDDKILIRYLMRHNHTSPFEMIEFKFKMKMPIFVCRQMVRHRCASANELSGRYSVMPDEYYMPTEEDMRGQSTVNRQGSEGLIDEDKISSRLEDIRNISDEAFKTYHRNLEDELVREMSRIVLPLSTYTEWYWKIDLKNLLHLLNLRCDSHAQKEIRVYADAILELIKPIIPYTIEAWEDYSPYRGGMTLTKQEIETIKNILVRYSDDITSDINVDSHIERLEWLSKKKELGFPL